MIRLDLGEVAAAVGAPAPGRPGRIAGVATDSRAVAQGNLFACLRGARVDGHDFADRAVAGGAAALLVERPLDVDAPQLVVPNTLEALGKLAAAWRRQLDPAVVGITGSNGKTTVKEMVTAILALGAPVLSTRGNYNNELGVPLTLFGLAAEHRYAVVEMGAAKAGDIAYLASIAEPDVGVLCNVGPAHLEGFGSLEGVALAKGEMFAALPPEGWAVMNADEPYLARWRAMNTAGHVITFGRGAGAEVRVVPSAFGARMVTPAGAFDFELPLPGEHNLVNAATAAAACLALDVPVDQVRAGLEQVRPVPGRLNVIHADAGWTVIDDTYNANPASLYAALQVLTRREGPAWLVLGDMKELGGDARRLHAEMGEAAAELGVARLYAVGEAAEGAIDAFGAGGRHFETREALIAALAADLVPGVNCLVKGSRSMGMERVVAAISAVERAREAG